MGARGPAPKPSELKLLEGGRGHRDISLNTTFRPEVGMPEAPRWLNKEARKAWRRLGSELIYYNLLSKVDRDAFSMLCQTIGRLEIIERSITARMDTELAKPDGDAADALLDSTPNGLKIQAAIYQVLNKEQEKLHRLLAEFGLTPAQRARVSTAIRAQVSLFDANGAPPPASGAAPTGFADFK